MTCLLNTISASVIHIKQKLTESQVNGIVHREKIRTPQDREMLKKGVNTALVAYQGQ